MSAWAMASGHWVKRLFWPLVQRPSLSTVNCWHATAESEYADIRRLGFRQPVAIIPNGVDVPSLPPKKKCTMRNLIFVGRIHQIKGLDCLLSAWATLWKRFIDWQLIIAGPDNDGYANQMRRMAEQLKLQRVEFVGPLYGKEKWLAYRDADLFVLPTYSENFGLAVAESLAAGTPAIVSRGAPWSGLTSHRAGWWIDIGIDPLVAALDEALALDRSSLEEMGERGRQWMIREFSWPGIGQRMSEVYKWIVSGGQPPDCVRLT